MNLRAKVDELNAQVDDGVLGPEMAAQELAYWSSRPGRLTPLLSVQEAFDILAAPAVYFGSAT